MTELDGGVGVAKRRRQSGLEGDPADHARGHGEHDAVGLDLGPARGRRRPRCRSSERARPGSRGARSGRVCARARARCADSRPPRSGTGRPSGPRSRRARPRRRGRRSPHRRPRAGNGSPRAQPGRARGGRAAPPPTRRPQHRARRRRPRSAPRPIASGARAPAPRLPASVAHALVPEAEPEPLHVRRAACRSRAGRTRRPARRRPRSRSSRDQTLPPTRSRASSTTRLDAGAREGVGRGEAGEPGADDDDAHGADRSVRRRNARFTTATA